MVTIDSSIFEKMWNSSYKEDLAETRIFWDRRAEEFNKIIEDGKNADDSQNPIKFLKDRNALQSGFSVLDIGCGTGRYALEFAKIAQDVTGIDISPEMLRFAQKNTDERKISNVIFMNVPWGSLNIDELNWNRKFDLVFASMTPAINSKDTLIKMIEASKGYCFMSGFVYRKDKIKDELFKKVFKQNEYEKNSNKIYCAFNILWNMGIHPEIIYKNVKWDKEWTVDNAIDFYKMQLAKNNVQDKNLENKITTYIEEISKDGKVKDVIEAKIAWMIWKI